MEGDDDDDLDAQSLSRRQGMFEIMRQMAVMQRRFMSATRRERNEWQENEEPETDDGIGEELDESLEKDENEAGASLAVPSQDKCQLDSSEEKLTLESSNISKSSSGSSDEMEVEMIEGERGHSSNAIPITANGCRRRYSSNTSVSTSVTSGECFSNVT